MRIPVGSLKARQKFFSALKGAAALSLMLLPSCLKLDATLTLNQDSSVRLRAIYSISTLAYPLFSSESGYFPLSTPLSRTELDGIVSQVSGARVISYANSEDAVFHVYDCSLDFANPDALCAFLRLTVGNALYASENGRKKLNIDITCPVSQADDELVSRLDVLFGDYSLRLAANLPQAVISAPSGKIEGRTAVFQIKVIDLIKSGKNATWALSW
jgi:hypothetical protein